MMVSKPVSVSLQTEPALVEVGVPVKLIFSLRDAKGNPAQGLVISHERLLHSVIMSEDFQVFAHIHTENFGLITDEMIRRAVFPMEFTFPKTGRYIVSTSYLHETHKGVEQFIIDVGERGLSSIVKDFSRVKSFGSESSLYTVSLETGGELLQVEKATTLKYSIVKNGLPVKDLRPYLGAAMHILVVDVGLSTFMHEHGEIHDPIMKVEKHEFLETDRFGPDIEGHITFPYPGVYQIFGEFNHEGIVVVTSFMVEVGN
jgi:Cu+-exporting ATPase